MSVSGLSPQSFQKVNQLLKEIGKAVDPQSPGQATITESEAGTIVQAFDKLSTSEKQLVGKALQTLLQKDIFTVDTGARSAFAKALGVEPKTLEPQAPASAAPIRSVMKAAMQALTRPVGVDKKTFDELKAGLKDAPKELGDFVLGGLKQASEDGNVKLDGDARRDFTREFAARDQDGKVTWLTNRFGEDFAKRVPPIALSMMSNPPYFEELIAAFMITIVTKTNEEVLRDQMAIDQTLQADQQKGDVAKSAQKKAIAQELSGTSPSSSTTTTAPAPQGGKVLSTKAKLEAVVASIDARMKDGSISREDAEAIRGKLERFDRGSPVTKLLAEALGTAMQHSGLLANKVVAPRLEPIANWVKEVTGTSDFPKPTNVSSDKPLARALMESDRLEQRLAGFLVDAFIDRAGPRAAGTPAGAVPSTSQAAMEKFKPLLQQMLQQAAPGEVATPAPAESRFAKTDAGLLERFTRIVDARDKLPPGTVEQSIAKTVDRHAAGLEPAARQALKEGLKSAFDALPKAGKPSPEQVKGAFEAANGKVTEYVDRNLTPDEKDAKTALVGDALDGALEAARSRIDSAADAGRAATPDAQRQMLVEEIGRQREVLAKEAKANGYDETATDGMLRAFDAEAGRRVTSFDKTGQVATDSPRGAGADAVDPTATDDTRSRQLMFEKLKFKMNMLSEMMQAMSNVLNTMHQNAENTIRAIR